MSKKIYPNSNSTSSSADEEQEQPSVLTVWSKSLLFNCRGFTVFDPKGRLLFRVDNYSSTHSSTPILLMDAAGEPLLTIRRKRLCWEVHHGEEMQSRPLFSVRRVLLSWREEVARVWGAGCGCGYVVEGSYGKRSCKVYEGKGKRRVVAELQRKEGVGRDVFKLVVGEGIHNAAAMAILVVLDQIFGSR